MPSLALTRLDGSKFSNMKPSSGESVLRRLSSPNHLQEPCVSLSLWYSGVLAHL